MRAITALTLTLLCSGCAQEVSSIQRLIAPDVIEYSPKTQKAAAAEIEASLQPGGCPIPTLIEFVKDYGVMRDQSRAIVKGK